MTIRTNTLLSVALLNASLTLNASAGEPQKWETLPKAVQATVLAHGGKAGMSVDQESETTDGKATFEAGIRNADGTIHDFVITADGALVAEKTDDAADAAGERADRAAALLKGVTFSHPREITNPYLPLAGVTQDILEGKEDGKSIRVERTAKPDVRKTFSFGGMNIAALAFEDRDFEDGKLTEVTTDYFAQDDAGTVYYLGEDVDEYEDGKVTGHDGTWQTGKDTPAPGVLFPAKPTLHATWRSEDVSSDIAETDEIVSMSEHVKVGAGEYADVIKVKETAPDEVEFKYYAKDVGVVREMPPHGDVGLLAHGTTK